MNVSYYEALISHLANKIWLKEELKRYGNPMQSVAEDVEYEDVSEPENKLIEAKEDE